MHPSVLSVPPRGMARGIQCRHIAQLQGAVLMLYQGRQHLHRVGCDWCPMRCAALTTLSEVYESWQTLTELPFSRSGNDSL